MRRARRAALTGIGAMLSLAGCEGGSPPVKAPVEQVDPFPAADRPVAAIVSSRWSNEEARDRVNEAGGVMDRSHIKPGMTVADIGAGEGYYTIRLAERVGKEGRVLAEDIFPETRDKLAERVARERLDNVSVRLGEPANPKLPGNSFDRIFMVHMYHEIAEPYAFLWHLSPALKADGELIVVDADRPTDQHGTPRRLLTCELAAMGFRLEEMIAKPTAGGYMARFRRSTARPDPSSIVPCALRG